MNVTAHPGDPLGSTQVGCVFLRGRMGPESCGDPETEYLRAGFGAVCFACLGRDSRAAASEKWAPAAEFGRGVVPADRC